MSIITLLTASRLREVLHYDQDTGIFTRIADSDRGRWKAGAVAGRLNKRTGYVRVGVDGAQYQGHRLAWLYVHGEWPPQGIDHKDTTRHHNWIDNLRPATQGQNLQNQRKPRRDNKSGFLGVCWSAKYQRWLAQIKVHKTPKFLGYFDFPEQAYAAYLAAKAKFHPFQTLVNAGVSTS